MFILSIGGGRVDYNHSDGWALGSLGITPIYDWHYVDKKPTGPVIPDIIRVNTTIEWYISGYHVWGAMAGVGSDGTAPRRMTSEELNGARASVTGTVDDATDCRDYIAALIIRVASIYGVTDAGIVGTSPEGLFDAVASSRGPSNLDSQGGIFVEDPKYSDSRRHHAASSWEWVSPGMKQPGFGSVWMAIGTSPSAVADAIQSSQTALIIVHELMHNAFKSSLRGSDQDFAFAAADIEGVAPDLDFSNTLVASKYWDGQLAEHCKPDRLRILQ